MPRGRRAVFLDEVDQLRDVVRGEDRRQVGQKRAAAAAALDAWARAYGRVPMGDARNYGPVVEVGGHQIQVSTDGQTLTWTVDDAPRVSTRDPLRDIVGSR